MRKQPKASSATGERREFPRVSVNCEVRHRAVDLEDGIRELGADMPGVMKNISGGGICFSAPERQPEGQMLALEIELPGFPSAVLSYGRVAWSRPRADGRFDVGVEFWWIGWNDDQAQHQIRNFLSRILDEGAPSARREDPALG
jgi:Tfp pilus assembly protein PilZ